VFVCFTWIAARTLLASSSASTKNGSDGMRIKRDTTISRKKDYFSKNRRLIPFFPDKKKANGDEIQITCLILHSFHCFV